MSKTNRIPKISDDTIQLLMKQLTPLVIQDALFYSVSGWERGIKLTSWNWYENKTAYLLKLEVVDTITTYHTGTYYGFFRPTVYEVFAQLPEKYYGSDVMAFTTDIPIDDFSELMKEQGDILNEGYHRAETTLYRLAKIGSGYMFT